VDDWLLNLVNYLLSCLILGAFVYAAWRCLRCPRCRKLGMLPDPPDPPDFPFMWGWRSNFPFMLRWSSTFRCRNCGHVEGRQEFYGRAKFDPSAINMTGAILAGLLLGGLVGSRIWIVVDPRISRIYDGILPFNGSLVMAAVGGIVGYAIWRIGSDLLRRRRGN